MYKVKILKTNKIANNVKSIVVEKPNGYVFVPGQATEILIEINGFKEKKHPFTFTSKNSDEYLEFIIKRYPESISVTNKLHDLRSGDSLLIGDPFGSIQYKGTGLFLAAGSGITPFISILRELYSKNEILNNGLIFSNKSLEDIILFSEIKKMISRDDKLVFTLTKEERDGFATGRINRRMIKRYMTPNDKLYICGPKRFVRNMIFIAYEYGKRDDEIIYEK